MILRLRSGQALRLGSGQALRLRPGRAPQPCFETNKALEAAARKAEVRKNQAIGRLMDKLGPDGPFEQAMRDLIDAGQRTLQEKEQ